MLVPSEAEGSALPLVEAIHLERPVLCRDLQVLRELASDEVRYFDGLDAASLAAAAHMACRYRFGRGEAGDRRSSAVVAESAAQLLAPSAAPGR